MAHRQPMVKIRVEGKNLADCDFFTKSDPYLILSRPASRGVYEFKQVRKTETIRNNLNPSWKLIYISLSELCDNDVSLPIRLTVFDYDHNTPDDFIGQTETTLQDLMSHSVSGAPLVLKIGEKRRGEIYVRQCEIENTPLKVSNSCYPEKSSSLHSLSATPATAPPAPYSQPQQMSPRHMQPHLAPPQEGYRPQLRNQMASYHQQQPTMAYYQHPQMNFMQPNTPKSYQQPQMAYQQASMNYQQPQMSYQQASMNYQQPQMSYQQAPTSFQNFPSLPQHSSFSAFPDDPTDPRPQSIWINP